MSPSETFATRLRERIHEAVLEHWDGLDMPTLVVERSRSIEVLQALRDDGFDMLSDVSAVDHLPREPRFDVNYHLYSFPRNERVRIKVRVADGAPVASCVGIWPTADWQEREVYDLMGIAFTGHPDLRRILMPDEWIGHPHRKDYPTGGVPVEYKIEPAYIGTEQVSDRGRPSRGGLPSRLAGDRGRRSPWTWSGAPAAGIRRGDPRHREEAERERARADDPPSAGDGA